MSSVLHPIEASALAVGEALINEVVSDNDTSLLDEDGDAPDWIELSNPTNTSVDLSSSYLSDAADDLTQWQFPVGASIPANGYLVVFASDKDRRIAGQPLHTNFKLSSGGEDVFLVDTDGVTIIDSLVVPALDADRSFGRTATCDSISLEAESGVLSGTFQTVSDAAASNGAYVHAPDLGVEDYTDPSVFGNNILGSAVFDFTVSGDGVFRADALVTGINGGSDSFFARLDTGQWWLWDVPSGGFQTDAISDRGGADPVALRLTPGQHRLEIAHREDGTRLDRIDLVATECFGGNAEPRQLIAPTPGAANTGEAVASVTMTPPAGVFDGSQSVVLSSAADGRAGTIRYTTDGSNPTSSSPVYAGPITLTSTTILRSRMFSGSQSGNETSGVFTGISGIPSSDLPIVIVDSLGQTIPRSDVSATVTVIDNAGGVASALDTPDYSGLTDIKVRGSSSAGFPKKQFKLELADATGEDVDADLLGLGEEEDWILYAPGRYDRNMIANPLIQTLAGQVGLTPMDYRFVEVYLNEDGGAVTAGDYHGLYVLGESIKIDPERVNITKPDPAGDVTGGYIISIDRVDTDEYSFPTLQTPTRYFTQVNVVRPKLTDLSATQQAYIEGYITSFETALYGPNFADPTTGYRAYIDVPSFIDSHLLKFLSKDPDIGRLSTYFAKDRGGLLRAEPVWDVDRSFNSVDRRSAEPAEPWFGADGIDPLTNGWWGRLFDDPAFRIEYTARWNLLRTNLLADTSVQSLIDDLGNEIAAAYLREDARWGSVTGYGSRFGGLTGELSDLKSWLATRSAFLDETLTEMLLPDLAEGQVATQSSTDYSGVASRAVDGDTNGRYDGDTKLPSPIRTITHTATQFQPWWQVDLGAIQDIGSIRVWNRNDCCADRLTDFHVFVSDNPFTSTSVAGTQAQAGVTDLAFAGQADRSESFAVNRTGRYVRIQLDGTNALSLAEVEVFEDVAPPPPPEPVDPGLILNEWNAVSSANLITGGDPFFGNVAGNGGDWFELVVVEDNLDVRGWQLELRDSDAGAPEITDTFVFADDPLLADLRSGTIITVAEDVSDDVMFRPATGDWTINLQADSDDSGAYFTADSQSNFDTNNQDWQLRIIDDEGVTRFGPVGEGIGGLSGVGSSEVGELELDPSDAITPLAGYDDGDASTFGAPNETAGVPQDFAPLRSWFVPDTTAANATLVSPADNAVLTSADIDITGTATDDTGVAEVRVSVQDTTSGLFLQVDGSLAATPTLLAALLGAPEATSTTWSLPVVLPVGSYELSIAAVDVVGNDEVASTSSFTVVDTEAPTTPTGVTITDTTSSTITLTWTPSTDNVAVTTYNILRDNTPIGTTTTTTYTDTNLNLNTTYAYTLTATDAAGNTSDPTNSTTATTTGDTEAPTTPAGVTITDTTSSTITLTWTPSTDNVAVTTYNILRDNTPIGTTTTTTYTDTNLAADTSYAYTLTATDAAGNTSDPTNSTTGSTEPAVVETGLSELSDPVWQANGAVHAVVVVDDIVFAGGEFTEVTDAVGSTVARSRMAAFDRVSGTVLDFGPAVNNKVLAMTVSPDETTLYVVGSFTTIDGVVRKRVAAFDIASGELTSFKAPSPNKQVQAVSTDGARLFIGGLFTKVGGIERERLAAYDIASATLDNTWLPSAGAAVNDVIVDGTRVWVAGNFNTVNDTAAKGLAAVDSIDGSLLPTNHSPVSVFDIDVLGDQLFVAGNRRALAVDRLTGLVQWSYWTNAKLRSVDAADGYAYFGGNHTRIRGTDVAHLTRLDVATAALDSDWLPTIDGAKGVMTIAVVDGRVFAGGDFSSVTGEARTSFAAFSESTPTEGPALVSLTMFDVDENGFIDQVQAVFDTDLAPCDAPCTAGWDLTAVPSGGTLNDVTITGTTAVLNITEGAGSENTAVGAFTVSLGAASEIEDIDANRVTLSETTPVDAASPVVLKFRKTNSGTTGLAEAGDTITTVWSEALDPGSVPTAADVVIAGSGDVVNDQLDVPGYFAGPIDLGADDFIVSGEAVFTNSPITLSSGNKTVTLTLAPCTTGCENLATSTATAALTYTAAPTMADVAANPAVGAVTKTFKMF